MNWSTEIMSVDTESRIFLYILGFSNELSPYMLSKVKRLLLSMLWSVGLTVKPCEQPLNSAGPQIYGY